MQTGRGALVVLAIGVFGCGSSNSSPTPSPKLDAAPVSPDVGGKDVATAPDMRGAAGADGDTTRIDTGRADAALLAIDTPTAHDTAPLALDLSPAGDAMVTSDAARAPDASPISDLAPSPDSTQSPDVVSSFDLTPAADAPVASDLPPGRDASANGVVTSTNTADPSTNWTVCSTVKMTGLSLTADQSYDIVMPDCPRLSGTITLDGILPSGAVFANGGVNAFSLVRDGNGKVTDTTSYAATITAVDNSHFKYDVGVPAGTYDVMYTFVLKSSATIPSTVSRYGQDQVSISQNLKHDVTLSALDLVTSTVTLTGTDALPPNGNAFGRFLTVFGLNPTHTLMVSGFSMTAGASVPISMWIPNESFTPTLLVQDTPEAMSPYRSGFTSQFFLDPVAPATSMTLALPAAVKISGTISDPNHVLSGVQNYGMVTSPVSYYHCDSLDYGTYPNPILQLPETSVSSFLSAATSHALYARKGTTCVTSANYAIAVGPGGLPGRAGENTYAYMQDPTPKSPNAVTLTGDLVRNINVPDLGTQIAVRGTVKDARGNGISGANLSFTAFTLTTSTLTEKTYVGGVDATSTGSYVLHALPGTYFYTAALPKSDGSSSTADAGAPKPADAGTIIGGGSDASAADCATLAACCNTLSGSDKTTCNSVVSMNMAAVCVSTQSLFRSGGKCP